MPVNFCNFGKNDIQPQPHLCAASPTPAGSRDVRLTLCDGPTLSETRGRPFVAPRAAAVLMTRASVFVFGFSALCVCLGVCVCVCVCVISDGVALYFST